VTPSNRNESSRHELAPKPVTPASERLHGRLVRVSPTRRELDEVQAKS